MDGGVSLPNAHVNQAMRFKSEHVVKGSTAFVHVAWLVLRMAYTIQSP